MSLRIRSLILTVLLTSLSLASCALTESPAQVKSMDSALAAASRYIVRHQSKDGAWRSETYSYFKDGPSQTGLVMSALFFLPQGGNQAKASYRKGVDYLIGMVNKDGSINDGPDGLAFPVLSAASASRVVVLYDRSPENLRAQAAWLSYTRKRQLNAALGWRPSDPEFGGWGFSLKIPKKPGPGEEGGAFFESNMVATVFAVSALRSSKIPPEDASYADALLFAEKCQNFQDDPQQTDARFDDGGFYFIPHDPAQNKAGIAGKDRSGRERFYSYGSMSADGLRVLLRCGLLADHPRVVAARKWLEWNFDVHHCPGTFAPDREVLRDATYYYYCWAVAHAFMGLELKEIGTKNGKVKWAELMASELLRRQRPDGSWVNRYTDAREDDPLIATSWAAAALAICREVITGEMKELVPRRALLVAPVHGQKAK